MRVGMPPQRVVRLLPEPHHVTRVPALRPRPIEANDAHVSIVEEDSQILAGIRSGILSHTLGMKLRHHERAMMLQGAEEPSPGPQLVTFDVELHQVQGVQLGRG